jgi:hypothetical protein
MLKKQLFAVSTEPSVHNRLTTQAEIVAEINSAGSPRNVDAHIRLHKYDYFAANAWLRFLSDERFSEAAINALAPDQQNARVVELWDAYGRFWQTLNLCPYSFARFRRLCEKKWGYASYATGGDGFTGKINTPYMNGNTAIVGEWRTLIHQITYTPESLGANPNEKGRWTPAWGGDRSEFWTGNDNPEFGPTDVIFGDPQSYAFENAGARPEEANSLPENAFAPTVEIHRVWIQRNGATNVGCYPNGLNAAFANSARFQTSAYNASSISFAEAWRRFRFQDPRTYRAGQQWNDWNNGFTVPDARQYATTERGMDRAQSTDVQWSIPPLKWYWELLRGSQTLTRGNRQTGTDEFTGSIIEYLSSKTTEEIIREVMLDVVQRNVEMKDRTGRTLEDLAAGGEFDELKRMQDAAQSTAQINSFIAAGGAGLGGILTVAAGPAGAAVAGTLTAAAKLLNTLLSGAKLPEGRRTDIFGRLTPTLETVSIKDGSDDARNVIDRAGLPPGVQRPADRPSIKAALDELLLDRGLTMDISMLVESGALIERQGGRLRIIGMPPSGRIEVGPTRRPATGGRWEPDGQTVYVVDLPLGGPLYVRVTSPSGDTRVAKIQAAPTQSVDLTWANMFGEHQFEVTAFPPGGHVFVDGIESMGTWKDATMTAWLVFMPQGNRDLRLVPPAGDAVVTSVAATGPTSVGSWIALSSVGIQQRQEAAAALAAEEARKKRSKQLMIAGGVGLAAVVVVGGIMLIRRKPQANPGRRRRR